MVKPTARLIRKILRQTARFALGGLVIGAVCGPVQAQSQLSFGRSAAGLCFENAQSVSVAPNVQDACFEALDGSLSPNDRAATLVNRAIIRARLGQTQNALNDYAEAERLAPDMGQIFLNRAGLYIRSGRILDGRDEAQRAIDALRADDSAPDQLLARAYFARAIALETLDELAAALADYQRAQGLDPNWSEPTAAISRFTVSPGG